MAFGTVYLLGVLLVGTVWGFGLAAITALASAVAFDYCRSWPDGFVLGQLQNWAEAAVRCKLLTWNDLWIGATPQPPGTVMTDLLELFHQLVRFETELWNAVDARLRGEFDLPLSRLEPMQVIARRPACRVNDIAEELSITIGGTSKLVDRIEAAGYCVRRANPDDRRSSIIELTAAGRRVLANAAKAFEEELETRIRSAVSARSLQELYSTIIKLRAANARVDDGQRGA